jgi:hypothetical protein
MQHLGWRLSRDAFAWHTPMGGRRDAITGALMKSLGAVAGFPDVAILTQGKLFCVELKAARGKLSPAQVECHSRLRRAGATIGVAGTIDEATALLSEWGVLL